ncbi:MAG TPA: twin-arginine translocase TatA/TatE family subunit [Desulfobacteria bacterium]|nr:twin-arginine translocase TatA/TatE family subunit [Desulfobacteria bacterium]
MFGIGMPELIIILVIALVVIGPKKLPDLAKALGKGLSEFKKATSEIKEGLNLDEDFKEARNDLADAVSGLDKPPDLEKTESVEEASPKFQDYDEMLDAYHQEKTLPSEKAEEVSTSTKAEKKGLPETPAEKDQDGK